MQWVSPTGPGLFAYGHPRMGVDPQIATVLVAGPGDPVFKTVNTGFAVFGQPIVRMMHIPAGFGWTGGEHVSTLVSADHLLAIDGELWAFGTYQGEPSVYTYVGQTDVLLKGVGYGMKTDQCRGSQGVDGTGNACYGQTRASLIPTFAGAVRVGELTHGIPHALTINVGGCALNWSPYGGKVWPASATDDDGSSTYIGQCIKGMYYGTLLAIPWTVDVEALGIQGVGWLNVARALQRYGAYLTDRNGYTTLAFDFAVDANSEWNTPVWATSPTYADDAHRVTDQIRVVTNSFDPTTGGPPRGGVKIDGGDGQLLWPLAPDFDR